MARRRKKKASQRESLQGIQTPSGQRAPARVRTELSPLLKAWLKPKGGSSPQQERTRSSGSRSAVAASVPADPPAAAPAQVDRQDDEPSEPSVRPARELRWLNEAYEGAVPLAQSARRSMRRALSRAPARSDLPPSAGGGAEQLARARLNALVGEGVRFDIHLDEDGWAEAVRHGISRRELRRLRSPTFHAEASLDLHGLRVSQVDATVNVFVRRHHRMGCRYLLIVHGKGLHSVDQCGVLGEAALRSLTRGGAAPLVRALAHAHEQRGGRGALAIALM